MKVKDDIAAGSLALTTFLGLLLILPIAWLALWIFPRGLIPDFTSMADFLVFPLAIGICCYPILTIWTIRRGWRFYREGRYPAAFRASLVPWLIIGLCLLISQLQEALR